MVMFCRFQRPVDFEPKMNHVKRELVEIADRIHLLDLHSVEVEIVQGQLDHCMVGALYSNVIDNTGFVQVLEVLEST